MSIIIVSPSCTADSAKDLANWLDIDYLPIDKYINDHEFWDHYKIINWGCSKIPHTQAKNIILNQPRSIRRSLNKIRTFELLSDKVRMPIMSLDKQEAIGWAMTGRRVVCRELAKSCKSRGITITNLITDIESIPAKFYTRFIANCTEYRINVYKGKVYTVYRKDPCGGDFRFKIQLNKEEEYQTAVQDMITAVHEYIGLDMFGLDVLQSPKGKWFLLEVNSAPILFPITYKRLANKIKQEFIING
jgi:RimK-like ATP-grasp domain.